MNTTNLQTKQDQVIKAWLAACEFEGIDPMKTFIVFRPDNYHTERFYQLQMEYLMLLSDYHDKDGVFVNPVIKGT